MDNRKRGCEYSPSFPSGNHGEKEGRPRSQNTGRFWPTDADWAQINKLRQALEHGDKAFQKALADLKKDPSRYLRVMRAYFPVRVREALRDSLADAGITEEDLRELAKVLRPARKH